MYFKVNSWMCTNRKIKPFREGNEHRNVHKKHIAIE